jgi:hypothetical protein
MLHLFLAEQAASYLRGRKAGALVSAHMSFVVVLCRLLSYATQSEEQCVRHVSLERPEACLDTRALARGCVVLVVSDGTSCQCWCTGGGSCALRFVVSLSAAVTVLLLRGGQCLVRCFKGLCWPCMLHQGSRHLTLPPCEGKRCAVSSVHATAVLCLMAVVSVSECLVLTVC